MGEERKLSMTIQWRRYGVITEEGIRQYKAWRRKKANLQQGRDKEREGKGENKVCSLWTLVLMAEIIIVIRADSNNGRQKKDSLQA